MKLSRLLSVLGADCPRDAEITALTCDSREVVPGALFAALPGHRADGRAYIPGPGRRRRGVRPAPARGCSRYLCG